jgi:hypothetical protein
MEEVSVLLLLATTAGVRLIFLLSLAFFAFSLAERPFFCLQFDRRFLRLRNDQSQLSGKEKKSEKRERRGEKASGTPPQHGLSTLFSSSARCGMLVSSQ